MLLSPSIFNSYSTISSRTRDREVYKFPFVELSGVGGGGGGGDGGLVFDQCLGIGVPLRVRNFDSV